jgi:CheY-like chemotaxis protein
VRVLVIEDNPVDLKLMRAVLQTDGHESLERSDARKALETVRSFRPDVILLDLSLAGASGMDVVNDLRQHWDTREIPIVAMTAYPHRFVESEVLAAGCAACIIKPINTRELANQLQSIATAVSRTRPPP